LAYGKRVVTDYFDQNPSVFSIDGSRLTAIRFRDAGNRPLQVLGRKSRGEDFDPATVLVARLAARSAERAQARWCIAFWARARSI